MRAEVRALPGMSAHADANEIMDWLRRFHDVPRRTFVTHGEPSASDALATRIRNELGWRADVPKDGEVVDLEGGTGEKRAPALLAAERDRADSCCESRHEPSL